MRLDDLVYFTINLIPLYFMAMCIGLASKYLRLFKKSQTMKFTQEAVRAIRQDINDVNNRSQHPDSCFFERHDAHYDFVEHRFRDMISNANYDMQRTYTLSDCLTILALYNELAVGINAGLYDKKYVQMVLGDQMLEFYKKYYGAIISVTTELDSMRRFMALELLLKDWAKYDLETNSRRY